MNTESKDCKKFKDYVSTLTSEEKEKLYQILKKDLGVDNQIEGADYVLLNVGYANRLQENIGELYDIYESCYGFERLLILAIGASYSPKFDCLKDGIDEEGECILKEHPHGKNIWNQLKTHKDGVLLKAKEGDITLDQARGFTRAIQEVDHCGCLDDLPYKYETVYVTVDGEKKLVMILEYDTESG
jgi:hypothetical protein